MLIYLAVENTPISRETLGVLLWPNSKDSLQQVRIALSDIRSRLGENIFKQVRNPIQVDQDTLSVDVLQFQKHATFTKSRNDPELATIRPLIDHAKECFLAGFTLRDCPDFDSWLQLQEQVALRDLQRCYRLFIRSLERNSEIEGAIAYTRQLVHLDPFNEAQYRLLMELYAKTREFHQVKKVYRWVKQTLHNELGVEPDHKTQALYQKIKRDLQTPERPDQEGQKVSAAPGDTATFRPLPYLGQTYFGRRKEQKSIIQRLADVQCRLVSIVGMGGIGKTHLVTHIYAEISTLFPDGVFYIPLESITDPDQLASEVASTFQIPIMSGELLPQIIAHLQERQILIILDNLEQLLPGAALLINNLVQLTDNLKILVTSRLKLHLHNEYSINILGLDYPPSESPPMKKEALQNFSAVRMFLYWAEKKNADFQLTPENAAAVRRLCALLEGLPLALRLAAAWVEVFSPTELVAEIHRNLAFVRDDLHDTPTRHRSFRALFRSVWDQITTEERAAFTKLCIFRTGFSWHAARAITGTTTRELKSLVEQSLLTPDPGRPSRYHIHEILRFFGQRQQTTDKAQTKVISQFVNFYADFVQSQELDLMGGDQLEALHRLDLEYDNIQKAWALASNHGLLNLLEKMIVGLHLYLVIRNKWVDGKRLFESALADTPFGEDAVAKRVHGKLSARFRSADNRQLMNLGKILKAASKNEDWSEVVYVSMEIGYLLRYLEYRDIAIPYFEYALKICQDQSLNYYMGQALLAITDLKILLDDPDGAYQSAQKSLEIMELIGDKQGTARAHIYLGELAFFEDDFTAALDHMISAKDQIQKFSGAEEAIYLARVLPWILFFAGDFEQSFHFSRWLQEISQQDDLDSPGDQLLAVQLLGLNEFILGHLDQSRALFAQSFSLLKDKDVLITMRGQIQADSHLFFLSRIAEALSHFLLRDDEQCQAVVSEMLSQPATHKRPLLLNLLLAIDLLQINKTTGVTNTVLVEWLESLPWAKHIIQQQSISHTTL